MDELIHKIEELINSPRMHYISADGKFDELVGIVEALVQRVKDNEERLGALEYGNRPVVGGKDA